MKKIIFILILVILGAQADAQNLFRSGIFLHHSTGACIWGPNGSSTSVPQEMDAYNTYHGYSGSQAVTMTEEWWAPGDNEWVTQHNFFEDPNPVTGIGYYLPGNKIIVIKSCFPSSAIETAGEPSDTLTPDYKTVYNYKWHWRHILNVIKAYPQNFFVIWTNAPLEPNSTNAQEAALSKWFCTWAKDTLANGMDLEFGPFPANAFVFDFFHKLTGPDGMMLSQYASSPGDSHPNADATALVAPQFVGEIFDASIAYEQMIGIPPLSGPGSGLSAVPNPFRTGTTISFRVSGGQNAELALFDAEGKRLKTIWSGKECGERKVYLSVEDLPSRTYYLVLQDGNKLTAIVLIRDM
jgi:hypothetical protein